MSKSRVVAVSTALTVGASALVAPQSFAATVGEPKDGKCAITYTEAEVQEAEEQATALQPIVIEAYQDAVEALFPGAKKIVKELLQEPVFVALVKDEVEGKFTEAELEALGEKYEAKFKDAGIKKDDALLILAATKDFFVGLEEVSELRFLAKTVDAPSAEEVAELRKESKEDLRKMLKDEFAELLNESEFSAAQVTRLQASIEGNKSLQQAIDDTYSWYEVNKQVRIACASGGNQEVKLPTGTVKPGNNNGTDGTKEGSSLKGEDGKLTPGAIAGIVIGVLAVLGVAAAAAAPMLGIKLPAMPKLPF